MTDPDPRPAPTPGDPLALCIAELERRRDAIDEAIKAVRVLQAHADLLGVGPVAELTEAIIGGVASGIEVPKGPHKQRMIDYFLKADNRPSLNREIRRAVGLGRGAVAVVLYSRPDLFEKLPAVPGEWPRWRLREEVYERLRSESRIEAEQPR